MEIDRMLAADAPPIMAILRGVKPEEAVAIEKKLPPPLGPPRPVKPALEL